MIRCVTSARVFAAEVNLLPSSAPTSPVSNTTVTFAGPPYTLAQDESFTSPWSRRVETGLARYLSDGKLARTLAKFKTGEGGPKTKSSVASESERDVTSLTAKVLKQIK